MKQKDGTGLKGFEQERNRDRSEKRRLIRATPSIHGRIWIVQGSRTEEGLRHGDGLPCVSLKLFEVRSVHSEADKNEEQDRHVQDGDTANSRCHDKEGGVHVGEAPDSVLLNPSRIWKGRRE